MIFVTGDTHGPDPYGYGSVDGFSRRLNKKNYLRSFVKLMGEGEMLGRDDFVIIAGDFGGIWNYDSRYDVKRSAFRDVVCLDHGESKNEKYWLDWLNERPFTTLFCDGNHENFDRLDSAYPEVDFHGGRAHRIRDNVFHLMRGYVFELDGREIFVFGGASSHDVSDGILHPSDYKDNETFSRVYRRWKREGRQFRVDHVSWWERELPTEEEMNRGIRSLEEHGNKVDFIVTHCAPRRVAKRAGFADANRLTGYFDSVMETVQFDRWYYGHYHDNRTDGRFVMLYDDVVRIS